MDLTPGEDRLKLLGERAQAARHATGRTQAGVAAAIGMTRSSIANIEAGRQDMTASNLVALARALGVTVGQLVGERPLGSVGVVESAARGVALSAIEEQAVLLMHDQADRLRDPGDYADRFIAALLDIRRALGREWGWPDPRLRCWFDASSDEDPAYRAGQEDTARDIEAERDRWYRQGYNDGQMDVRNPNAEETA